MHPYSSIDMTAAWEKVCFILSVRPDFYFTNSLSMASHVFASHVLMSVSVDEEKEWKGDAVNFILWLK